METDNESDLSARIGSPDPFLRDGIGSFSDRLELVLGSRSVREFAYEIGVSEGTLRSFKKGRIPRADDLLAICRHRNVDMMWLLTGEGEPPQWLTETETEPGHEVIVPQPYAVHEQQLQHYQAERSFLDEFALVDGYHVQVGAGVGQITGDEPVRRRLAFRRKWLRYRQLSPDKLALVFAKGDSMEPTIYSNDTILVDTAQKQIVDGSIFVIRLGDELYAKRLQKLPDGGVHIISDNPGYSMLPVPAAEMPTLQVIGKVVWIGHDV